MALKSSPIFILIMLVLLLGILMGGAVDCAPTDEPTPSAAPGGPVTSNESPTREAVTSAPQTQSWKDWFWQNAATLLLGILAVVAGYIALKTLSAINIQANIARTELENLERPWIVVIPVNYDVHPQSGTAVSPRYIRFTYSIQNAGRSPTWLNGGISRAKKVAVADLPAVPDYGDAGAYTLSPLPAAGHRDETLAMNFSAEEYRRLTEGTLNFVILGIINYRDALGRKDHETRYCICLEQSPTGLSMTFCGPDAYNSYT